MDITFDEINSLYYDIVSLWTLTGFGMDYKIGTDHVFIKHYKTKSKNMWLCGCIDGIEYDFRFGQVRQSDQVLWCSDEYEEIEYTAESKQFVYDILSKILYVMRNGYLHMV